MNNEMDYRKAEKETFQPGNAEPVDAMSKFVLELNDKFIEARAKSSDNQTVPRDRQGTILLNTGDSFTRVNGTESVVTPDGNGVALTTRPGGTIAVLGRATQIEMSYNGKPFNRINALPSGGFSGFG